MRKLGATNRVQALATAAERGMSVFEMLRHVPDVATALCGCASLAEATASGALIPTA